MTTTKPAKSEAVPTTTKVLVNTCFGGFGLTQAVYEKLGMQDIDNEAFGIVSDNRYAYRAAPALIDAVIAVGLEASASHYAKLAIREIPDDIEWEIDDCDGAETILEVGRSW
jgi:hypothetical protein